MAGAETTREALYIPETGRDVVDFDYSSSSSGAVLEECGSVYGKTFRKLARLVRRSNVLAGPAWEETTSRPGGGRVTSRVELHMKLFFGGRGRFGV